MQIPFFFFLGEGSGQSEPLLSSLDDESSSIVMNQSFGDGDDENITVINGGPDTPLLISYQVSRVTTVISRPFGENGFDLNKLCVCVFD